jgi:protein-disulfide isomerase
MTTRRDIALGLGTTALAAALQPILSNPALAQAIVSPAPKPAANVSVADLAVEGPLGDVVFGSKDAKVTIIEYASLTCSHCAKFHVDTFPALKKAYLDSGKVKYVLREFPLDPLAMAGFMLARCEPDKYYPLVDMLFTQQRNWAFVEKPVTALTELVKQAGFTQESFEACLKRGELYDGVNSVKNRGAEKLGVSSTPTFFINGQRHTGALTIEEFNKILAPLVGG